MLRNRFNRSIKLRIYLSVILAFSPVLSLSALYSSAALADTAQQAQTPLEIAQANLAAGQATLSAATTALATANATLQQATTDLQVAQAAYDDPANRTTTQPTTTTQQTNVVQNGTFDDASAWSGITMYQPSMYNNFGSAVVINGMLKGSYSSGNFYYQQGTFASPVRNVTFSVDVLNNDNQRNNTQYDYYRIEFRTYSASGARLNYYNLEYSGAFHDWITRSGTYNLSADAVRWDVGFRLSDGGYWNGNYGPAVDNVRVLATTTTTTPGTTTINPTVVQAKNSAQSTYDAAVTSQAQAQSAYDLALAAIPALEQAVVNATPRLDQPTNLTATLNEATQSIDLTWTAPLVNQSGVTVERYAISWSTTNFTSNGWGGSHDQTSISIPLEIIRGTAGSDINYQFAIRADNDTQAIYSAISSSVSLFVAAPVAPPVIVIEPTPTPTTTSTQEPTPTTEPTPTPTSTPTQDTTDTPVAPYVEVYEGQQLQITVNAPNVINVVSAWYGSPNDPNCGADVTSIVAAQFNGLTDASISADNGVFGDPCGGVVKVLRVTVATAIQPTPPPAPVDPTPVPTTTPEPVVLPEPTTIPTPTPTPTTEPPLPPVVIPDPQPTVEPSPTPTPQEPQPSPTPTETSSPEPSPTAGPTATPSPEPTQSSSPEPTSTPMTEPTKEPTVAPELPIKEVTKAEDLPEIISVAQLLKVDLTEIVATDLTPKQAEALKEAALETFKTADPGSPAYEQALDALMVAAQQDDIVVDEALASIPGVGEAAVALANVLNALSNVGADMNPTVRDEAQKATVAAVIVGQVAGAAVAASASSGASSAGRRQENNPTTRKIK